MMIVNNVCSKSASVLPTATPQANVAAVAAALLSLLQLITPILGASQRNPGTVIKCDVVVAGGSTASLAAAITAATVSPEASICLTDPTDWVGGQMTASAVSAIDFGANSVAAHQSKSFRDLMAALGAPRNPGACWVSKMCYEPTQLLEQWIHPTLAALPNLRVLNQTVVTGVEPCGTDDNTRTICALTAVQRLPKRSGGAVGWSKLLSASIEDWYDPVSSSDFDKASLRLEGSVFIDATEFGDILVSGAATALKLPVVQGVEEPLELSNSTDDQCGQAATLTFYMGIRNRSRDVERVPLGSTAGGAGFDIPMDGDGNLPIPWKWDDIWLYRRAKLGGATPSEEANCPARHASGRCAPQLGDLTQQNWGGGNDLDNAYLFAPLHQAVAAAKASQHRGGMNLTALSMLEQRAYGWYHYFKAHWSESNSSKLLRGAEIFLDLNAAGTHTGLAKMPYLRDTRRSVGLDGFRLAYTSISNPVNFDDTVAIGSYAHDTHGLSTCKMPRYVQDAPASRPYFIPLRALTSNGADNLLVAGKTMATTFSANSATRLHPDEWSSGVAAGAAATLLVRQSKTNANGGFSMTRELIAGKGLLKLKALLKSSSIQQPLDWGVKPKTTKSWFGCGIANRCYGLVSAAAPFHVFTNDSTCDNKCPPLRPDQWLANADYWTKYKNDTLIASNPTALKKSEEQSLDLPPAEVKKVDRGFGCELDTTTTAPMHGYYLCSVKTDDYSELPVHPRLLSHFTPAPHQRFILKSDDSSVRDSADEDAGKVATPLAAVEPTGPHMQFKVAVEALPVTDEIEGTDLTAVPFPREVFQRSFGSGHASLGLRRDWQAAVGRAAKDYGLGGIRQHGIFDDDMGPVARRGADGSISYNFTSIFALWDGMLSHGVHPVVELSFMPSALANCTSGYAPDAGLPACPNKEGVPGGWVKTGQTGGPRRWSEWFDLVFTTVSHAVKRYGLAEVQGWEFEVWK